MKPLKVLIGCEHTGRVRDEFRKLGHHAFSCDLLPCDGDPTYHLQGDVRDVLDAGWDLAIFHPECTFLTNAGVKHLYVDGHSSNGIHYERWWEMEDGIRFFKELWNSPIPRVAIENPIMHGHARALLDTPEPLPEPQIVQPWWFGDRQMKSTCIWSRGLPKLQMTDCVGPPPTDTKERHKWQAVHRAPPGPDRWKFRSATFPGLAKAMATQYSRYIELKNFVERGYGGISYQVRVPQAGEGARLAEYA